MMREEGQITMVAGKVRSGKSAWTKQRLKRYSRIIAWDAKGEYAELRGWRRFDSLADLARACKETPGPGRFAYVPKAAEMVPGSAAFDRWARLAYTWVQVAPCAVVAEELADVTNPGKAPPGWGQLIRKSLVYGADIYAISQRPAESDKTAFGNAARIVCFQLVRVADQRYMAGEMGIDVTELIGLQKLDFVESNLDQNTKKRGRLAFKTR